MFGKFIEKYYPDGTLSFEGLSQNGIPNGYGKSYFRDGSLQYEGTWADGKYHGNGTLYDESGREIYTGEWFSGHQFRTDGAKDYKPEGTSPELKEYLDEMNSLIGLMNVKKELHGLINFVRLQSLRRQKGLKLPAISLHMVFTGNPGTGKTTVARYLGQTAIKTEEKIKQAVGGVLADYREDLVVIVAGYPALMKKFIDSNPGLASRFSRYVEFTDYSGDELMQIFDYICGKYSYSIDTDGREILREYVNRLLAEKNEQFGNARTKADITRYIKEGKQWSGKKLLIQPINSVMSATH